MEFRWAAFIALWTILSGPVFAGFTAQLPRPAATAVVSTPADTLPAP